jgi:predicted PurR-regulated permease PerM
MPDAPPPSSAACRRDSAEVRVGDRPRVGSDPVVVGAIAIAALYVGREIFVPLALAILLSFVLSPIVLRLRRWRGGRVPSVVLAVALAFAVILGVGSIIGSQLARLAGNLPHYENTIREKIQSVQGAAASVGVVARATSMIDDLEKQVTKAAENRTGRATPPGAPAGAVQQRQPIPVEISEPPSTPLKIIESILGPLLPPLATAGIVIIFVIFILLQREDMRDRLIRLAGGRDLHRTTRALDEAVARLSRYLLTQGAVNAGFGALIGAGLFVIGVPNPVLWGILAALLRFVPYIGAPIAAIFPSALAIAVDPGWSMLFWTLGLFLGAELVIGQLIEPLLYGQSTGLSALAIVVAAMFWTWLWGPVGLLLSTPLTVCLVVLGRHVERLQFLNVLLSDEPALDPDESFYQRMLAGDPDEAAHQAEQFLKEKPLSAYYDEVAIKGLALAQLDVNRGLLDREQCIQIKEAVDGVIDDLADHDDAPLTCEAESRGVAGCLTPVLAVEELPPAWREGDAPVLSIAGRGPLDEAAGAMLAQLIRKHGIGARVVPSQAVLPANVLRLDSTGVIMVCLSYLEPSSFANARYVVRRLRQKLPRAKILLGLWAQTETDTDRLEGGAEIALVATTLAQAVHLVVAEAKSVAGTPAETESSPPTVGRLSA